MRKRGILIIVVSIAVAVMTITATAYVYAHNFQAQLAYKTNIRQVSSFNNVKNLTASKTLSGERSATFENLDLSYEPVEEFEFTQLFSFENDNEDLNVISSDGTSAQIPIDSAVESEILLSSSWDSLIENENVEVLASGSSTTITFFNVASVSEEFEQMLQTSLLTELEAIFEGFSVDSLSTEFENSFDAEVILEKNKLKSIEFRSEEPIVLNYSLTKVTSEQTEINDDVLKGTLSYSNLEIKYLFSQLEYSPEIPSNPLLLLGYSILY